MSQIFEYTKHSDRYLIHNFKFGGNDDMGIGQFTGNYSMNKFMSPLEWRMIFNHLAQLIEKYRKKPTAKRPNDLIDVADTNIELKVEWTEMDATFYRKIFPTINSEMIYPFVMVVKVGCKSNMNKFVPPAGERPSQTINNVNSQKNSPVVPKAKTLTAKAPTAKASTPKSPVASQSKTKTPPPKSPKKPKSVQKGESVLDTTFEIESDSSVEANGTRPFTIPLDRLTVDEIEKLTGSKFDAGSIVSLGGGIKRKYELLNDSVATPQKEVPAKRQAIETPFANSVNSTPYVRLSKLGPDAIETDVSRILVDNDKPKKNKAGPKSSKNKKVKKIDDQNRLTKTPLSSKRGGPKSAKPRLRLSISHLTAKPKKLAKLKKSTHKDKKTKKRSKLVNDDSSPMEVRDVDESDPIRQPSTSRTSNNKENDQPESQSNGHSQPIDLKSLTEEEVNRGFSRSKSVLASLFQKNVRQKEVQRAGDYIPIDIITLLTPPQFSEMLDILYDHFKGYSNEECDTIFFDILIPEWTLDMFMRKTKLTRDAAIKLINSQKTQDYDESTMLSYISFRDE